MSLLLSRVLVLQSVSSTSELRQLDRKLNPFRGESAESPVVLDLLPDFRDILRPDVLGVTFAGMTVAQLVVGAPT